MSIPFFQVKLRELISEAEEKYNLYQHVGWDNSWIAELRHALAELRHAYLKALLKEQLKDFNK